MNTHKHTQYQTPLKYQPYKDENFGEDGVRKDIKKGEIAVATLCAIAVIVIGAIAVITGFLS